MTRNEGIKCASKDYVNYLLDKQEYHNENYTEDDIRQAFVKGAMFADKNPDLSSLWHDASEEPKDDLGKDDSVIIYQDKYGNCWFITKRDIVILYINWECFATVSVRCWAYVDDLLPKQFGNSEQLKGGER